MFFFDYDHFQEIQGHVNSYDIVKINFNQRKGKTFNGISVFNSILLKVLPGALSMQNTILIQYKFLDIFPERPMHAQSSSAAPFVARRATHAQICRNERHRWPRVNSPRSRRFGLVGFGLRFPDAPKGQINDGLTERDTISHP